MRRPLVLIHGYSANGAEMMTLKRAAEQALSSRGIDAKSIDVCNYVSLNNEITIEDLAEGLDRALRKQRIFDGTQDFDAIVHSTGMLVMRAWLANGGPPERNQRRQRLKHLIGLAPATWGSPQAHKGRTWLGALVKGNRTIGPDFLNAGDLILKGLELGSRFTWDLAHKDLLGEVPFYDKGQDTPYVAVFIGNKPYEGLASVANDPGTDGTVRWSGCGLNSRKIVMDLTIPPASHGGRARITGWALSRLDIPIIAVNGRNHGTLIEDPEPGMVDLAAQFLDVFDEASYEAWLTRALEYGKAGLAAMQINPGAGAAGLDGAVEKYFGLGHPGVAMDGWQQIVVRARDQHGDGIEDYMIEILAQKPDGGWKLFEEMYTDVHAYCPDRSYRCFHLRLPAGVCSGQVKLRARIHALTGTDLVAYHGYSSDPRVVCPTAAPIELDLNELGEGNGSLFRPFTTTLIEIVFKREPMPPGPDFSKLLTFLEAERLSENDVSGSMRPLR
jgi:hypothetical protein